MVVVRHVLWVLMSVVRFGLSTRNLVVALVALVGLALLAVAFAAQVAAPFVLYPFA
jgi:hypothetical protein